ILEPNTMTERNKLLKSLGISKPTLIIDKKKVLQNIKMMTNKAKTSGVRFRPHFKTHQSAEIGNWFKDFGVASIAVSSLDMALYFAKHGWNDITVAFIANTLEIDKINVLTSKIKLNLLVDSEQFLSVLDQNLKHQVGIWIKIDTGFKRTGVRWDNFETVYSLAEKIKYSHQLDLRGLLTHAGHSYRARSKEEIRQIHRETVSRMVAVKEYLKEREFETCEISVGDTPTCSLADDFTGVDEIRPGNFVFYDLMQEKLGSCNKNEMAVAVACPVVGKYKDRNQIVMYGGAVHFSNTYILDENGRKIFGYLTSLQNCTFGPIYRNAQVISVSQEHGIVSVDERLFEEIEVGDFVLAFPVHSCLTCNLHKEYYNLTGDVIPRL
ncbi:MAG: alanine racemase, partial [Candidatus Zixiibacteriota bacterium]